MYILIISSEQYEQHRPSLITHLSQQTVIVVVNVRTQVAKVRVEAALRRRVPLHVETEVPLAHDVRAVTAVTHVLGQQLLVQTKAERLLGRNDKVLHAHVRRILAAHQRRPRRRAHGRHIVPVQADAKRGQRINVGRGYLIGAVEADIVEALREQAMIVLSTENNYFLRQFVCGAFKSRTRSSATMTMMCGLVVGSALQMVAVDIRTATRTTSSGGAMGSTVDQSASVFLYFIELYSQTKYYGHDLYATFRCYAIQIKVYIQIGKTILYNTILNIQIVGRTAFSV